MSLLIQYINEQNLNNPEYLKKIIMEADINDLMLLIEKLRNIIEEDYMIKEHTPFTFIPNGDLSGTGGCDNISCKLLRASSFAAFSALYADDVYIQLKFITSPHLILDPEKIKSSKRMEEHYRYWLITDIELINLYSELISASIVHITPPKKAYCKDCFQEAVLGIKHPISIDSIKNDYYDKARIMVHDYNQRASTLAVTFENLDEFFPEHSHIIILNKHQFKELPISMLKKGAEIVEPKVKTTIISNFIETEFYNACYDASYCKEQNAKLITNKLSDSLFLNLTTQNMHNKSIFQLENYAPEYDMPYVANLQISDVLKLRELENESFNKYRIALNKASLEQIKTNNKSDWYQIYDDILYPAFNDLDMKLKLIKNGRHKKHFASMVIIGTSILASSYAGIIPENVQEIFSTLALPVTAIGGNYLLGNDCTRNAELMNNDYYFLWRLRKENKYVI